MQWAATPEWAELVRIAHALQTGAQVRGGEPHGEAEWRDEVALVLREAALAPSATPRTAIEHLRAEFD